MFALVYFVGDLSPGPGRKKSEKTPRGAGRASRTRQGSSTLFSIARRFKVGQLSRETSTRFRTPPFSLSFAHHPPRPPAPSLFQTSPSFSLPPCKSLSKCSMQLLCRWCARRSTAPFSATGIISPSPAVLAPASLRTFDKSN